MFSIYCIRQANRYC